MAPGERRERIDQLEEYVNRPRGQLEFPEIDFEAPHFTENLADLGDLTETEAASLMYQIFNPLEYERLGNKN